MKFRRFILRSLAALALLPLVSCGLPLDFRVGYQDPENGIDVDAGYSTKRGLSAGIDYTSSK